MAGRKVPRLVTRCGGDLRTEQGHAGEVNINQIMARYRRGGVIPALADGVPKYGDFSGVDDYHSALNAIQNAEIAFMSMPAVVRKRFENDPGRLLSFLSDPNNRDEAVDLGLVKAIKPVDAPSSLLDEALTPSVRADLGAEGTVGTPE